MSNATAQGWSYPLKGLARPATANPLPAGAVPNSLQYAMVAVGQVMTGINSFDSTVIDQYLADAQSQGCHLILRPYLDLPGLVTSAASPVPTQGMPPFLLTPPYSVQTFAYNEAGSGSGTCPNYADPNLETALMNFIAWLGGKYNSDPRVAFIEAGLLGFWGEWHCDTGSTPSTEPDWTATYSSGLQQKVLAAYQAAFPSKLILLRYPAGSQNAWGSAQHAMCENDDLPFGYHDDSFCVDTLQTGNYQAADCFLPAMTLPGTTAGSKWQKFPIGGQFRLSTDQVVWTGAPAPGTNLASAFLTCVQQSNATYILSPNAVFGGNGGSPLAAASPGYNACLAGALALGYNLHVESVTWARELTGVVAMMIKVKNIGNAPFYGSPADWWVELDARGPGGQKIAGLSPGKPGWNLHGILPGQTASFSCTLHTVLRPVLPWPQPVKPAEPWHVYMRVASAAAEQYPSANWKPFLFANASQKPNGELELGPVPVFHSP